MAAVGQNESSGDPEGKRKSPVIEISAIQRKHHQKCQNEIRNCFDRNTLKDDKYETVTSDTSNVLVR